jgi:hypothetical protein
MRCNYPFYLICPFKLYICRVVVGGMNRKETLFHLFAHLEVDFFMFIFLKITP